MFVIAAGPTVSTGFPFAIVLLLGCDALVVGLWSEMRHPDVQKATEAA